MEHVLKKVMRQIKLPDELADTFTLDMSPDATFVACGLVNDQPVIWVHDDPEDDNATASRCFRLVPNGVPFDAKGWRYLGTYVAERITYRHDPETPARDDAVMHLLEDESAVKFQAEEGATVFEVRIGRQFKKKIGTFTVNRWNGSERLRVQPMGGTAVEVSVGRVKNSVGMRVLAVLSGHDADFWRTVPGFQALGEM